MKPRYNPKKAMRQLARYEKKLVRLNEKLEKVQTGDIEVDLELERTADRLDTVIYDIERAMILYQDNN